MKEKERGKRHENDWGVIIKVIVIVIVCLVVSVVVILVSVSLNFLSFLYTIFTYFFEPAFFSFSVSRASYLQQAVQQPSSNNLSRRRGRGFLSG